MKRMIWLSTALLCCVCSMASCRAVERADEALSDAKVLIGKVSAKVDQLGPAVTAASETAKAAIAVAQETKAKLEAKADVALNTLAERGAPVDGTAGDLLKWVKDNPMQAAKDPALVATALAALLMGYKRRKALTALAAVVKGVEDASPDAQANVKAAIKDAGGSASGVRELIREVKKEVA